MVNLLDSIADLQNFCCKSLLNITKAPELDQINKKRIRFHDILYPIKTAPIEWWYFTGHLNSGKHKFGFEFCFFKIHPQALRAGFIPLSFFKKDPYLIVHMAITDKKKNSFTKFEDTGLIHKYNISYEKVDLSLNNVSLRYDNKFYIKSNMLRLNLRPIKKIVKHYDEGFKVTYAEPEHRTYYVTFPRLEVKGQIKLKGKKYNVTGIAWFDHQKCNAPGRTPVVGWDWFSIIFDNKTELMFFMLRDKKGFNKKYFGGSFIDVKGKVVDLKSKDVIVNSLSTWKSPNTGIVYPSGWKMDIPKYKMKLKIIPCVKDQEMDTILTAFTSYWEGACDVIGMKSGKKITGLSYVELAGYDKRLIAQIVKKSIQ